MKMTNLVDVINDNKGPLMITGAVMTYSLPCIYEGTKRVLKVINNWLEKQEKVMKDNYSHEERIRLYELQENMNNQDNDFF